LTAIVHRSELAWLPAPSVKQVPDEVTVHVSLFGDAAVTLNTAVAGVGVGADVVGDGVGEVVVGDEVGEIDGDVVTNTSVGAGVGDDVVGGGGGGGPAAAQTVNPSLTTE
jgi:hypothetical protein